MSNYTIANTRTSAIAHVKAAAVNANPSKNGISDFLSNVEPRNANAGPRVQSSIKPLSFVAVTSVLSRMAGGALAQSSATTSSTEPLTFHPYADPCRGADGTDWISRFDMCVTRGLKNPISGCCVYAPTDCWAKIAECAPLVTTPSISSTFTTMTDTLTQVMTTAATAASSESTAVTSSTTPETTSGSSSHPLENYQIGLIAAGVVVTTALIASRVPAVRNAASSSVEWIRNQLRTPPYAPQQNAQPLGAVVVDEQQQNAVVVGETASVNTSESAV